MELEVTRVTVLVRKYSTNMIWIHTLLPGTFPYYRDELTQFKVEAANGTGADWVRNNLHLEPEVINE